MHADQAVVSWSPAWIKNSRMDAGSVIAHPQLKLSFVIADLHFNAARVSMAECISQGFACDSITLAP